MNRHQIEDALRRLGIQPTGVNGDWVQARCPFAPTRHQRGTDRTPSFGVKAGATSVYNCLSCKSKGRFIDLPKELSVITGEPYEEVAHDFLVAEATGLVVEAESVEVYEPLEPLPEGVYGDLFPLIAQGSDAHHYAASRNCLASVLNERGVRDWPEEGRLMFPVRDFGGGLHGWTGRSYRPDVRAKVWNTKGLDKSCHLLGAEHCTCERPIVVVEGLMFYARLHSIRIQDRAGVDVVAAMGSNLSFEQADLLAQVGQPVILFFDNDKAGKLGTWGEPDKGKEGALHILARAVRTHYVNYPGKLQDPDDLDDDMIVSMIETAPVFARKRRRHGQG